MKGITAAALSLLLFVFVQAFGAGHAFDTGSAFGATAAAVSADTGTTEGTARKAEGNETPAKEESKQTKPTRKVEWLVFSATEHQDTRKQVVRTEHMPVRRVDDGTIYIALADLNDDGTDEVFAYFDSKDKCGSFGCTMNIYRKKSKKLVPILGPEFNITIDFDKKGRQKKVSILPSTTKGWRDVKISDAGVLRWNGKSY